MEHYDFCMNIKFVNNQYFIQKILNAYYAYNE